MIKLQEVQETEYRYYKPSRIDGESETEFLGSEPIENKKIQSIIMNATERLHKPIEC